MKIIINNADSTNKKMIEDIQKKLFRINIKWEGSLQEEVQEIVPGNGDTKLMFIIKGNVFSWTNESYGMPVEFAEYEKVDAEEFLSRVDDIVV